MHPGNIKTLQLLKQLQGFYHFYNYAAIKYIITAMTVLVNPIQAS